MWSAAAGRRFHTPGLPGCGACAAFSPAFSLTRARIHAVRNPAGQAPLYESESKLSHFKFAFGSNPNRRAPLAYNPI